MLLLLHSDPSQWPLVLWTQECFVPPPKLSAFRSPFLISCSLLCAAFIFIFMLKTNTLQRRICHICSVRLLLIMLDKLSALFSADVCVCAGPCQEGGSDESPWQLAVQTWHGFISTLGAVFVELGRIWESQPSSVWPLVYSVFWSHSSSIYISRSPLRGWR